MTAPSVSLSPGTTPADLRLALASLYRPQHSAGTARCPRVRSTYLSWHADPSHPDLGTSGIELEWVDGTDPHYRHCGRELVRVPGRIDASEIPAILRSLLSE